ncbi:fimbrial protein [Cronobacter dublinensis]|uniref:fimbrial protein n=1 Tax=Cronobacter dublinensis TaxID=413497 RepID=UPI001375963E|nr:fimbrial protein [Cronobacter dublinensis]NCH72322.1 type 1 fimbrial protein [Cronobacter dublinensis]
MKKTILGLAISAMFMVGAVQAETNANDVSATLSVTGTVTANDSVCSVVLSDSTVALNGDVSSLVEAGQKPANAKSVIIRTQGDNNCTTLLSQGKLAYKFLGTADGVDGTTLANSASAESAAQGVGIGLYNMEGTSLKINEDTATATSTGYTLQLGLVKLSGSEPTAGDVQGSLTIQIERL